MLWCSNSVSLLCISLFQSSFCCVRFTAVSVCLFLISVLNTIICHLAVAPVGLFFEHRHTISSRSYSSTTHVFCSNKNWNNAGLLYHLSTSSNLLVQMLLQSCGHYILRGSEHSHFIQFSFGIINDINDSRVYIAGFEKFNVNYVSFS
jgi:hypothetical protein